ncbi:MULTISPECIES: flagellar export protein FliJ [Clostridium]|uniref:flagellar export protein FliJ n=1 Tax=Clostridium TaxID=1485 RepID=UPI0008243CEC|nr:MULTISPECIES: flagellar export protein FliJ [Clostridium]PJI09869.1 flagellar export protein FliJ [Clostridium sp. CT7]
MAVFNFRLQKLLDLRMQREEESKLDFKKSQDKKNEIQNRIVTLKNNYNEYFEKRISGTVIEQKVTQNYLNFLVVCIDEAINDLERQKAVVEEKRKVLVKKQVERKTVDVLKEKQRLEFEINEKQNEQKINDELALYSFMRNSERG